MATSSIFASFEIMADLDRLSSESGHSQNELIGTLFEFAIKHCVVEKYHPCRCRDVVSRV